MIRDTGYGPGWIVPAKIPFKLTSSHLRMDQTAFIRVANWLSPCIWDEPGWAGSIRRFLHGSALGRSLIDSIWRSSGDFYAGAVGFDKHPETAKLKPWMR